MTPYLSSFFHCNTSEEMNLKLSNEPMPVGSGTNRRRIKFAYRPIKTKCRCGFRSHAIASAHLLYFSFRNFIARLLPYRCGLTIRSTGRFAAVRVWAPFHSSPNAALRKSPVSSNVRPHTIASRPRSPAIRRRPRTTARSALNHDRTSPDIARIH